MPASAVAALVASGSGLTLAATGQVLAAATDPASPLPAILQGGGSAAAVGGIVYVARLIVKGDLVPKAVAFREEQLASTVATLMQLTERSQKQTDSELQQHAESMAREKVLAGLSDDVLRLSTAISQQLGEALEAMRYWRDRQQRAESGWRGHG